MLAPQVHQGALADEICYEIKGIIQYWSPDYGVFLEFDVDFEVCNEGGEADDEDDLYGYATDNGYTDGQYVIWS